MSRDPVFVAYAITVVVNWLNLTFLWNYSGGARGKSKTTLNPEDATTFTRDLAETDPPDVARVLRAHRNTADNTLPFLFLGLVFAMLGPNVLEAQILFGTFTVARLLYSVCYLKGIQPWRTAMYAIGTLASFVVAIEIVRKIVS